jgi:predicted RNase H-like nuclease (RuvC/YqgF family)
MSDSPKSFDDVIGMLTHDCHVYALEIERLKHERIHDLNQIGGLQEENARLKAEVEELKSQPDPLTAYLYADTLRRDDIKTLKAHIDRLTKAGDAMAMTLQADYNGVPYEPSVVINAIIYWNAAKEGKQS